MKKSSVYPKRPIPLISLLILAVLVVLVVSTGWFMSSSQDATATAVHNISEFYLEELSDQTCRQLQNALDQQLQDLEAALQVVRETGLADHASLQHYMTDLSQIYHFDLFALVDEDGLVYTPDGISPGQPEGTFPGQSDHTFPSTGQTDPYITIERSADGRDMLCMTLPIEGISIDEKALTYGVAGIASDTLIVRLDLQDDKGLIFSNVVSADGSYIVKTPHYHLDENDNIFSALEEQADFQNGYSAEQMRADLQAQRAGITAYRLKGELHYTYYALAQGTDWYLTTTIHYDTVSTNVEAVSATITQNSMIQLASMLLVLSAVFFVYFWQRRRNETLHLEKMKAEESSRAKSLFLSNMSHDIRTPMNAIIGFTDLAIQNEKDPDPASTHDYLVKIRTASRHLLDLINDVLDMSRIESGKIHLDAVPCDLCTILRDMETILHGQIQEKGSTLTVEMADVRDHYVYCDKLRLDQILLNLLGNAVKFTPAGGHILLTLSQKASQTSGYGSYEFQVADNGIGMSQEFAKKVFEPFERERTSTVSGIQGTGLGMAITKNLVDLMKGSIQVETAPGKGTTFRICLDLPLCKEADIEKVRKTQPSAVQSQTELQGKRVLLVEDNELNREIAMELLLQYGFEVEEVQDGSIAVEMLRQAQPGRYDLVLMDIQMPIMDGYAATRTIRAMTGSPYCSIPIVAMTANAFEEDKKAALENGMDGHIAKPVDVTALIELLHSILKPDKPTAS